MENIQNDLYLVFTDLQLRTFYNQIKKQLKVLDMFSKDGIITNE